MKTHAELDRLKSGWCSDPCWDIEDTEEFEEHREELLAFRKEMEERWENERQEELENKAEILGVPNNLKLAEYVLDLEKKLEKLKEKQEKFEDFILQRFNTLI